MSCYLVVYQIGPPFRVVLAHKKIFGTRLHGQPHPAPLIWNNCGQLVIPGGAQDPGETPEEACLREFYEETALDFREPAVRQYCGVIGAPIVHSFGPYSVAYLQVGNADLTQQRIAANLAAGTPADDELQDVGVVEFPAPIAVPPPLPVDGAGGTYWQIGALAPPPMPMPAGDPAQWRYAQYQALNQQRRARANLNMAKPVDWFVAALNELPWIAAQAQAPPPPVPEAIEHAAFARR